MVRRRPKFDLIIQVKKEEQPLVKFYLPSKPPVGANITFESRRLPVVYMCCNYRGEEKIHMLYPLSLGFPKDSVKVEELVAWRDYVVLSVQFMEMERLPMTCLTKRGVLKVLSLLNVQDKQLEKFAETLVEGFE